MPDGGGHQSTTEGRERGTIVSEAAGASERIYRLMRSFPKHTDDLSDVCDTVEQLSIGPKTRKVERLAALHRLRRLWVGGATSGVLDNVVRLRHLEELVIAGARATSLPGTWQLPRLQTLLLDRCAKLTSIEPLKGSDGVEILGIISAKRLSDYGPLRALSRLRTVDLGEQIYYERQTIDSLAFLSNLTSIENLALRFSFVADGSLKPIARLSKLRTLEISNTFPREQFAYLAAHLPQVQCPWFPGYVLLGKCPRCTDETMVMLTGKGQRSLCANCDRRQLEQKLNEFKALVASARTAPS